MTEQYPAQNIIVNRLRITQCWLFNMYRNSYCIYVSKNTKELSKEI